MTVEFVGVAAYCYSGSIGGALLFDDEHVVTQNPDVRGVAPLAHMLMSDYWGKPIADPMSHKSYRPLTVLTLRLNHAVHGLAVEGYHAVNVLLHAAATLLVHRLCPC